MQKVAGIVAEYNPFHRGHAHQIAETRRLLGDDCAVLCVMSGDFVQRGDAAVFDKFERAEAAVRGGADLVLELPLRWSLSSAEGFARGAVSLLAASGVVTHLSFGSETGELAPLQHAADGLRDGALGELLRDALKQGLSFPAARQKALERLIGAFPPRAKKRSSGSSEKTPPCSRTRTTSSPSNISARSPTSAPRSRPLLSAASAQSMTRQGRATIPPPPSCGRA